MKTSKRAILISLANREFLFKGLRKKAFLEFVSKNSRKSTQNPFVTISRDPGSGGRLIARRLATALKLKFYDQEILENLGQNKNVLDFYKSSYDEKDFDLFQEFINSFIYPSLLTQDEFVQRLSAQITALTLKGNCLILGRGANFFTDFKFGFHARITAPLEFRIQKEMQFKKASREEAVKTVLQVSKEREDFVEKYFSHNINNPEYYDLIINREYYSIDQSVELLVHAYRKKLQK